MIGRRKVYQRQRITIVYQEEKKRAADARTRSKSVNGTVVVHKHFISPLLSMGQFVDYPNCPFRSGLDIHPEF